MSTPEKCQHCGAPADGSQVWFTCGTGTIGPTLLCQERSAHAETKAELAAIKARIAGDNSDNCPLCAEIGMDWHSQSVPMCRLCQLESELAAVRKEASRE